MIFVKVHGPDHASSHVIDRMPCLIGRSLHCHVRIDDPSVSARHARVDRQGDGFVLQDLGSTNGILHGGVRVAELTLTRNELVVLGDVRVEIVTDETLPKTLRAKRLGDAPEPTTRRTAWRIFATSVLGYLVLCLVPAFEQYAAFWPPERPQQIATEGFALWLVVLTVAFVVSLFCKLNSRKFHFHQVLALMVLCLVIAEAIQNLMGTVVYNLHNVAVAPFLWHLGYGALGGFFVYRLLRFAFSKWTRRHRAMVAAAFGVLAMGFVQVMALSARGHGDRTDLTELGLEVFDPAAVGAGPADFGARLAAAAAAAESERDKVLEKIRVRDTED